MLILCVSDLRVQSVELLERVAERVKPDLILYAGDDVARFAAGPNSWSALAQRTPLGLAGVVGNDCLPGDERGLEQPGCHDLSRGPLLLEGLAILGLPGAPRDEGQPIGPTLYTQQQAKAHLDRQLRLAGRRKILLVSHAPPRGCLDLARRFGISDAGSSVVRSFARRRSVSGIVCGHVHLQGGRFERLAHCAVVNVASHDHVGAPLRYAVVRWDGARLQVLEISEEKSRDGLGLLPGVRISQLKRLGAAGFRSLGDLLECDDDALFDAFGDEHRARRSRAFARARRDNIPVVISQDSLPQDVVLLDVETSLDGDDPWLVGYKRPGTARVRQHQELDPKRHALHFEQVAAHLAKFASHTFIQWGSFDRGALERGRWQHDLGTPSWLMPERWLNATAWVKRVVALPLADHRLKTVASYFSYRFALEGFDGRDAGMLYSRFRARRTPFDVAKVRRHNRDDVLALEHVILAVAGLQSDSGNVEPELRLRTMSRALGGRSTRLGRNASPELRKARLHLAVAKYRMSLERRVLVGELSAFQRDAAVSRWEAAMMKRLAAR